MRWIVLSIPLHIVNQAFELCKETLTKQLFVEAKRRLFRFELLILSVPAC